MGRKTLRQLMRPGSGVHKAYRIPIFQRRYCWKTPQWDTLWQDIWKRNAIKHSLGRLTCTNVTAKNASDSQQPPEAPNRSIIIDGQQRFTTITLILAAIRDALYSLEETSKRDNLLNSIHAMLFLDPNAMNEWVAASSNDNVVLMEGLELEFCRLVPTFCDRSAYLAAILPPSAPPVEKFLAETYNPKWHRPVLAKQHFAGRIAGIFNMVQRPPLWILEQLVTSLLDGMDMLYFPIDVDRGYADGTEDTQVIYERLAIRDKQFCQPKRASEGHSMDGTDMIRNLLLGSFRTNAQKQAFYEQLWLPLERMFQTTALNNDETNREDDEESLRAILRAFLNNSITSRHKHHHQSATPGVIGGRIYRDFETWMANDFERWLTATDGTALTTASPSQSTSSSTVSLSEAHAMDVGTRLLEFATHRTKTLLR